jgi:hypothetical protein
MDPSVMTVVRRGRRWGVSIDGEVLALTAARKEAVALAHDAARILRDSGGTVSLHLPGEKRSFADPADPGPLPGRPGTA